MISGKEGVKKRMRKFLICLVALLIFSCNQANAGILYSDVIVPVIATDMETTNIKELKCGEAQISHILGLFDAGHAGIQDACRRAGITRIHHVDRKTRTFLGFGMTTIYVYGE